MTRCSTHRSAGLFEANYGPGKHWTATICVIRVLNFKSLWIRIRNRPGRGWSTSSSPSSPHSSHPLQRQVAWGKSRASWLYLVESVDKNSKNTAVDVWICHLRCPISCWIMSVHLKASFRSTPPSSRSLAYSQRLRHRLRKKQRFAQKQFIAACFQVFSLWDYTQ